MRDEALVDNIFGLRILSGQIVSDYHVVRARDIDELTLATLAPQRGRTPQLPFIMSSTRRAVVLGSTVTLLSSGAAGTFTLVHSVMMSLADAGRPVNDARASNTAQQICFTM